MTVDNYEYTECSKSDPAVCKASRVERFFLSF